ncbi:hypothetical protein NPIL_227751 [Nephila pilipes]|uniref:Uncharacterized protein n=1 Tax=Nephila pilipes TaxID=299642 RepID=A0A8X6K7M1_NEPPI|nr:hypothetical protein NPIL_227751 [Nephila pilipes]
MSQLLRCLSLSQNVVLSKDAQGLGFICNHSTPLLKHLYHLNICGRDKRVSPYIIRIKSTVYVASLPSLRQNLIIALCAMICGLSVTAAIIAPASAPAVDCKPIHPMQVKPSPPATPGARYWQ